MHSPQPFSRGRPRRIIPEASLDLFPGTAEPVVSPTGESFSLSVHPEYASDIEPACNDITFDSLPYRLWASMDFPWACVATPKRSSSRRAILPRFRLREDVFAPWLDRSCLSLIPDLTDQRPELPPAPAVSPLTYTEKLYTSLQIAYAFFNERLFGSTLPQVLFTLLRKKGMAGHYHQMCFKRRAGLSTSDPDTIDEIALNPEAIAEKSDTYVLQILLHEMVHVWQAYYGKRSRGNYHNWEFAERMEQVGLMTSTDGTQNGARVGQRMCDYIIPGGPFSLLAADLIKDGWHFTWEDRSARRARTGKVPVALENLLVTPVKDVHGLTYYVVTEPDEKPEPPTISPDIKPPPLEELPAQIRALLPEPDTKPKHTMNIFYKGAPIRVKMNVVREVEKVSRHKFKCPECETAAWAKPGTRMMCLEHKLEMGQVGVV